MNLVTYVRQALGWLWKSKLRILLSVVCTLLFSLLLFPFNDLSDLISGQVAAATHNAVYLQFEKLSLSLFPRVGAQAEQVYVESIFFPGLKVDELTVTPSLRAALSQKPLGHVSLKGLFKGDVEASISSGGTSERGVELQRLDINAQKLSLQELRQIAQLPALMKGRMNIETSGTFDMTLTEQPELDLNLKIDQLEIPQTNLPLGDMGEVSLPELKLSAVELKGKLSSGRLTIENLKIGSKSSDDLQGSVKGNMILNLRGVGGAPIPEFGAYTFEIDLQPSAGFQERAKFFLGLLAPYQQGNRIRMKVSGLRFGPAPSMTPLR